MSKHGFTRFTMTQTWGETTTFPLIVYSVLGRRGQHPNDIFLSGLPSGSFEIPKVGTLVTLGAHNIVCKPPIKVRFKENVALIEGFPMVCDTRLARKENGVITNF
jgi:hypothetical protein